MRQFWTHVERRLCSIVRLEARSRFGSAGFCDGNQDESLGLGFEV
jgi:hypothetical protein